MSTLELKIALKRKIDEVDEDYLLQDLLSVIDLAVIPFLL
jgi:hypothetical protein